MKEEEMRNDVWGRKKEIKEDEIEIEWFIKR